MLFRTLLQAWRGASFMNQVLQDFESMLLQGEGMFRASKKLFLEEKDIEAAREEIRSLDVKVNKTERKIRKRLVEHLSVNPEQDTVATLVMMSVVKDAERIGDYCKNFVEVAELMDSPLGGSWRSFFSRLFCDVEVLFPQTRAAFFETSKDHATRVMEEDYRLAKLCDEKVEEVARSELSTNQAVCYVLLLRYLKRVAAHLGNIASAVVQPVHKIDFLGGARRVD